MDSPSKLTMTAADGVLTLAGLSAEQAGLAWRAQMVDDRRILLRCDEATGRPVESLAVFSCPVDTFKDFFLGLLKSQFSGVLSIDTGFGVKRIFVERGCVVFAGSNIMDDRLGEVIFREAMISLDAMTNSAAQVTKARKFGQVLISSGIFSNSQLWAALKLQVRQILRSIFMVDHVFVEVQPGRGQAPTEVVFTESSADLIAASYGHGCAFRHFLGKLRAESEAVVTIPREIAERDYGPGTFVGDLISMIEQRGNVQELLNTSKLIDAYTVAALFKLVNQGLCRIVPEVDDQRKPGPAMAVLKAKLDAYSYVLQSVRKAFEAGAKAFPLDDLRAFVASLNDDGFPSLFVDDLGAISRDCVGGLLSQCANNHERLGYFAQRAESMSQFLLQVAGDNLEYKTASALRQDYRAVVA